MVAERHPAREALEGEVPPGFRTGPSTSSRPCTWLLSQMPLPSPRLRGSRPTGLARLERWLCAGWKHAALHCAPPSSDERPGQRSSHPNPACDAPAVENCASSLCGYLAGWGGLSEWGRTRVTVTGNLWSPRKNVYRETLNLQADRNRRGQTHAVWL